MKRGTSRHPKTLHLAEILKVRRPTAVGYLELLFEFTAEFAPQGNIGKWDDRRIEAGLDWSGPRGRLVAAMLQAGWIESHASHRLVVHQWHAHADRMTRHRLTASDLPFLSVTDKSRTKSETEGSPFQLPVPLPVPLPVAATQPPANGDGPHLDTLARSLVDGLFAGHPYPGRVHEAYGAMERILVTAVDPEATASAIRRSHEAWVVWWARQPARKFKPGLSRWLADGDYLHPPAVEPESEGY